MDHDFSSPSPATRALAATQVAGSLVRSAFYLFGALLFAMMVYFSLKLWNGWPRLLGGTPSFSLNAPALARLPVSSRIVSSFGVRAELVQYGQLHDRDTDMTALLVQPSDSDQLVMRNFNQEIGELSHFLAGAVIRTNSYYDLETRFGTFHAAEFTLNADGRNKLCIAWLSRLPTSALYLKGWYCEANGARPNFYALACTLDRLALDRDLPSAAATQFLRERMKQPARCAADPVSQTSDTRSQSPGAGVPYRTRLPVVRR